MRGRALPQSTDGRVAGRVHAEHMPTQAKTHRFPVAVRWVGGKVTCATVEGKQELAVATPTEFHGGVEGVWSPEDLLVASAATCFTVTLVSAAARRRLPLRALGVHATGAVSQRPDDRFGFTELELDEGSRRRASTTVDLPALFAPTRRLISFNGIV